MEAIPLLETSVVACAKASTFTWISCFGVPETITSDRGPQFTSNLWFQLREMLNILHKQTTAYHPESNGAVKRLHCRLKDALRARAAAATWSEELPFVLLGLRAQPREYTGLSPAEAVFGAQIVLPYEFMQNDEFSVDTIVKKCAKKHCMFLVLLCLGTILAPSCPASCQPSCSPPPRLGLSGRPGSTPSSAL
jgi:hypothetical protein